MARNILGKNKLKRLYLKKLKSIGIDISAVGIEDYSNFSIVSFSDEVDGELLNVSVTLFENEPFYEVIVRRKVDVKDHERLDVLEKINKLNTRFSSVAMYLEDPEIYSIRLMERFMGKPEEILVNISEATNIILKNDIK